MRSWACAFCGLDSIGVCDQPGCAKPFCGRHSSAVGDNVYCAGHRVEATLGCIPAGGLANGNLRTTSLEARSATLEQLDELRVRGHPGAELVYAYRPRRRLLGSLWDRPLTKPRLEMEPRWRGYHLGASRVYGRSADDAWTIVHWVFPSGRLVLPCHDTPSGWASAGPIGVDCLDPGSSIDFDWIAARQRLEQLVRSP